MSYTKLSPQPAQRASDAQGAAAPGLYPNEIAVVLTDTGANVAVGCERRWLSTNAGSEYHAWARSISADGTTLLSPHGDEIVVEMRHSCDPVVIAKFGGDVLAKECVLAVLGEPPTMADQVGDDGTTQSLPIIRLDDLVRANYSIRHAIALAAGAGDVDNLGSLL